MIYNYQRAEMMAGRAGSPLLSFEPDNAQSAVAGLDNSFTLPLTAGADFAKAGASPPS